MSRLPALFVSHGSPTIALRPEPASAAWRTLGEAVGRPRAVLVATAHWLTAAPVAGGGAEPRTVHDFSGFPQALYAIRYPAPGAPAVAHAARALLAAAGIGASVDEQRGYDHGTWVPLAAMYPDAGVPVAQISIQPQAGPAHHYAVGSALAPLGDEGVLVIGSGAVTHNLRAWMAGVGRDVTPSWVTAFAEWLAARALAGDIEAMLDYRRRAPHAVENHPSDEHLLPFFVALGAGGKHAPARRIHASVSQGVLAMDAYAFGEGETIGRIATALAAAATAGAAAAAGTDTRAVEQSTAPSGGGPGAA